MKSKLINNTEGAVIVTRLRDVAIVICFSFLWCFPFFSSEVAAVVTVITIVWCYGGHRRPIVVVIEDLKET